MGELWAEGEGQETENSPRKVLREDALPKREEPAFLPERNLFSKVLFLAISSLSCSSPFSWPTTTPHPPLAPRTHRCLNHLPAQHWLHLEEGGGQRDVVSHTCGQDYT